MCLWAVAFHLLIWETDPLVHCMGHTILLENTGFALCCLHLIWCTAQGIGVWKVWEQWLSHPGRGQKCLPPSPADSCSVYKSGRRAKHPGVSGVWNWAAPKGSSMELSDSPTVCLSSGALCFSWCSFPLKWTFTWNSMCGKRSSLVVQVEDGRAILSPIQPCPGDSWNPLYTLVVWMWEERLGVGCFFLGFTEPVSSGVETSPTQVPALCIQCSLDPPWRACAMHPKRSRSITNHASILSSVTV